MTALLLAAAVLAPPTLGAQTEPCQRCALGPVRRLVAMDRIGTVLGARPYAFGRIQDLAQDGLGRLFVIDALARELRVFHGDGRYATTVGREGWGPGEFQAPFAVAVAAGGAVVVRDVAKNVYMVRGGDRAGWRTAATGNPASFRFPLAADTLGHFYDAREPLSGFEGRPLLLRFRWEDPASPPDTLLLGFRRETVVLRDARGQIVVDLDRPFTPVFTWDVLPDGRIVSAHRTGYGFAVRDWAGTTVTVLRDSARSLPVSSRQSELARRQILGMVPDVPGYAPPTKEDLALPGIMPEILAIHASPDGLVWAQVPAKGGAAEHRIRLDAWSPAGEPLGRFEIVSDLELVPQTISVGQNFIAIVGRDEDDVEYVARFLRPEFN